MSAFIYTKSKIKLAPIFPPLPDVQNVTV